MKNTYKIILLSLVAIITSCSSEIDENQIVGGYGMDKVVSRDTLIKVEEYSLLLLNPDKSFELKNYNKKGNSKGTWKASKSKNDDEIIIEFSFSNRKVNGILLKGTIIYFIYPNDLYFGKYYKLLYVKLRDIPE